MARRDYGISDNEFWYRTTLARLLRLREIQYEQYEAANGHARQQDLAALDAAGL